MSIFERLRLAILILCLVLAVGATPLTAQESDPDKELRKIAGNWTLNPIAQDAPAPEAPPIYASYRKKDEPAPPALEAVPRILLEIEGGKLVGKAVMPTSLPMTGANQDVTGKDPVTVDEIMFDGTQLTFKVKQGDDTFEAVGTLEGRVIKGTWTLTGSDKQGALYLHRRYR